MQSYLKLLIPGIHVTYFNYVSFSIQTKKTPFFIDVKKDFLFVLNNLNHLPFQLLKQNQTGLNRGKV